MSICWSIMMLLRMSLGSLPLVSNTIAGKGEYDKATKRHDRRRGFGQEDLNEAGRIAIVCSRFPRTEQSAMTQTTNRFFDEIGRLMNDAAGAAQGIKREVDTLWRNQAEKVLRDLDIVKREEFEAVKDMARLAREENEALKARIAALEAKLGTVNSGS
jgi:BMFP domain-containing protein YqiC